VEVEVLQRVPPASDEEWAATMRSLAAFYLHHPDPEREQSLFDRTTFNAEATVRLMQVLGTWSAVDRLATVAVPTLVLSGRHDVFCPPAQSQRIARALSTAELVVLEGSGHLPWLEEPDAFCAAVERWLPTPK
jgi:pimeloyl-ACP methyl ester carboxylesterase